MFFYEQKLLENLYCSELVNRRCLQSEKKQILQTLAYYYNKLMSGLCIILFLASCNPESQEYIEAPLKPYYDTFIYEANRLGVQLPDKSVMMYVEDMEGENGRCDWNKKYCNVKINPAIFKGDFLTYNLSVEATVFHELGHGLLNRYHIENTTLIETSLMAAHHNGRVHWIDGTMREYYLNELFNSNSHSNPPPNTK